MLYLFLCLSFLRSVTPSLCGVLQVPMSQWVLFPYVVSVAYVIGLGFGTEYIPAICYYSARQSRFLWNVSDSEWTLDTFAESKLQYNYEIVVHIRFSWQRKFRSALSYTAPAQSPMSVGSI